MIRGNCDYVCIQPSKQSNRHLGVKLQQHLLLRRQVSRSMLSLLSLHTRWLAITQRGLWHT